MSSSNTRPIRIPVARPDLRGNEEKYVAEVVRSSWISSTGPFLDRFEREWAAICNTKHAVATSSGTTALHLALRALDVRPGDEVLVPSLTYIAVANAVRYVGAVPVFVDADPQTWCIDPRDLEHRITERTKGIIAVHLYGHPADMDAIGKIAAVHGLWVVEDAAEAHFAKYKGKVVGGLGNIGVFSFYGNKILSSGEGGALVVDDDRLDVRLRTLRGQGVDPERRYFFPVIGYNYRMTNVAAAILCAQVERAEEMVAARNRAWGLYEDRLRGVPGIELRVNASWAETAAWLMSILSYDRDGVMARLAERGIETRPFFVPVHRLPPYAEAAKKQGAALPVTDDLARRGLNLPTFSGITDDEINEICEAVKRP